MIDRKDATPQTLYTWVQTTLQNKYGLSFESNIQHVDGQRFSEWHCIFDTPLANLYLNFLYSANDRYLRSIVVNISLTPGTKFIYGMCEKSPLEDLVDIAEYFNTAIRNPWSILFQSMRTQGMTVAKYQLGTKRNRTDFLDLYSKILLHCKDYSELLNIGHQIGISSDELQAIATRIRSNVEVANILK